MHRIRVHVGIFDQARSSFNTAFMTCTSATFDFLFIFLEVFWMLDIPRILLLLLDTSTILRSILSLSSNVIEEIYIFLRWINFHSIGRVCHYVKVKWNSTYIQTWIMFCATQIMFYFLYFCDWLRFFLTKHITYIFVYFAAWNEL